MNSNMSANPAVFFLPALLLETTFAGQSGVLIFVSSPLICYVAQSWKWSESTEEFASAPSLYGTLAVCPGPLTVINL